jgi:hypothetical protein
MPCHDSHRPDALDCWFTGQGTPTVASVRSKWFCNARPGGGGRQESNEGEYIAQRELPERSAYRVIHRVSQSFGW